MADQYTKLWHSILDSSVWGEPPETRIVWITLLAMSDRQGYVGASVDGVSRRAAVSVEHVERALAVLSEPDPKSRSDNDEGRRIEKVARGWHIINYEFFRDLQDKEQQRAYERDRKRRQRAKSVPDTPGTPGDNGELSHNADATASSIASLRSAHVSEADGTKPKRVPRSYSEGFKTWWAIYPKKVGKGAAWRAWQRVATSSEARAAIMEATPRFAAMVRQSQFVPNPATWLNESRWEDDHADSPACAAPKKFGRTMSAHVPNTPIGSPSCRCEGCVAYRLKRKGA